MYINKKIIKKEIIATNYQDNLGWQIDCVCELQSVQAWKQGSLLPKEQALLGVVG